jgi:hypothetical protein
LSGVIEVSKGEQTSVGRNSRTVEFQLQARIECDPKNGVAAASLLRGWRERRGRGATVALRGNFTFYGGTIS